jgi:hypothetical protein
VIIAADDPYPERKRKLTADRRGISADRQPRAAARREVAEDPGRGTA